MSDRGKKRPTDREIIVIGVVCMLLSSGLCLALSLGLGSEEAQAVENVKRKMSMITTSALPGRATGDQLSELDLASMRPAQMGSLVADLGRAEMDLRMRRGLAMILSMGIGMGIFLALRALRSRPAGQAILVKTQENAA